MSKQTNVKVVMIVSIVLKKVIYRFTHQDCQLLSSELRIRCWVPRVYLCKEEGCTAFSVSLFGPSPVHALNWSSWYFCQAIVRYQSHCKALHEDGMDERDSGIALEV